jgi:hypothetical protein
MAVFANIEKECSEIIDDIGKRLKAKLKEDQVRSFCFTKARFWKQGINLRTQR